MFERKQTKLKRQEELKELLSQLYNGVCKSEYGDNYDDFKDVVLKAYQKVDQGKWDGQQIEAVCDYIQHIAMANYEHSIETPEVFSKVRPKLQKLNRGRRPILGILIYH